MRQDYWLYTSAAILGSARKRNKNCIMIII